MTSSCRWPPSLLAAGMPLEFRLTLDFMPLVYEHLHQTVQFRSINAVPLLRSDQQWRMGLSLVFSYLTSYPRFGRKCITLMQEVLRWSLCHPRDGRLPMVNPLDHASYAYVVLPTLGDGGSHYAAAGNLCNIQPVTVRTAGAPACTFQKGAVLDH